MKTIEVARWRLATDKAATLAAYRAMAHTRTCDCQDCRNFEAAGESVFPASFHELLQELGIDWRKAAETHGGQPEEEGLHCYGGWFHCVGEILEGPDCWRPEGENVWSPSFEPLADSLSIGFTTKLALVPEAFKGLNTIQLEFFVKMAWLLEEAQI